MTNVVQIEEFIRSMLSESKLPLFREDIVRKTTEHFLKSYEEDVSYSPYKSYKLGQHVFHPASSVQKWFTVIEVLPHCIIVNFDDGQKKKLAHNDLTQQKYTFAFPDNFKYLYQYVDSVVDNISSEIVCLRRLIILAKKLDNIPFQSISSYEALENYVQLINRG